MGDNDPSSPLPPRGQSPSSLRPAKRTLAPETHDYLTLTHKPIPWKMSPTVIPQPGKRSKLLKSNPFRNGSKEFSTTVIDVSPDLPRRNLFKSDWNLDHLKEKRKKPELSLPFKVDSKGKPLVPVALGSRQRMTSKS